MSECSIRFSVAECLICSLLALRDLESPPLRYLYNALAEIQLRIEVNDSFRQLLSPMRRQVEYAGGQLVARARARSEIKK
jgi:hypothetical protein